MSATSSTQLVHAMVALAQKEPAGDVVAATHEFLVSQGRGKQWLSVQAAFRRLIETSDLITFETAQPLSETDQGIVRSQLAGSYEKGTVRFRTNAKLLGGFRVWAGAQVIDNSTAQTLQQVKKALSEVSHGQ